MPRGNGTGPNGLGPMTGRAAGYCAGYGLPGYANTALGLGFGGGRGMGWGGRGFGFGFGRGFGWNRGFAAYPFAPPAGLKAGADTERWSLERQAEALEEELKAVRGRLTTLGNASEPTEDTK